MAVNKKAIDSNLLKNQESYAPNYTQHAQKFYPFDKYLPI